MASSILAPPSNVGKWVLTSGVVEAIAGEITVQGNQSWTYIGPTSASIGSISPTSGPTTGATTVTVIGAGFTGATTVKFGTLPAKFTFVSDREITAISPADSAGTVDISVITQNDGTTPITAADHYTYVASVAPPPPPPTAIQLGVYVGNGQSDGTAEVTAFKTATGTDITIAQTYLPWGAGTGTGGNGWAYLATPANLASWNTPWIGTSYQMVFGIPMVCQDASGGNQNTLAEGASSFTATLSDGGGSLESIWTAIATNLVAEGFGNAIIRPGWEFDGNWYPWMVADSSDAANFVAYWINIHTAMMAVSGAHFTFMWGPAGFGSPYSSLLSAAYPGNAYVDYITLDCYDLNYNDEGVFTGGVTDNSCTSAQSNDVFALMESNATGLNWLATFANSKGKPFGLAECACTYSTTTTDVWYNHTLGDDPTFISNVHSWMVSSGATVLLYFSGHPDGTATYSLTNGDFPNALAAYKANFGVAAPTPHLSEILGQQLLGE